MKRLMQQLRLLLALLSDIKEELQAIRKATEEWGTETRLLREMIEQAAAVPDKGHNFPDGFPYIDALVRAGFTSPKQLPRTASGLKGIYGPDGTEILNSAAVYEVLGAISASLGRPVHMPAGVKL